MCISPVRIRNPNRGHAGGDAQFKDCVSLYINVPCGHCPQCIANRQMQYVQRLQMESLVNHLFMCTLTYNNESMPVVGTSTGYSIRYADVRDVQLMFKRLRKSNAFGRPFRHFTVSELGTKKGRPHFHIVFMLPKQEGDDEYTCYTLQKVMFDVVLKEWRRNYGSRKYPDYRPLCTYVRKFVRGKLRSNYDLHYVNPSYTSAGVADVAFYVLKYMLKPSDRAIRLRRALHLNLPDDEYEDIWSLVRPRHFESEAFGLGTSEFDFVDGRKVYKVAPEIYEHLRNGIELSKRPVGDADPMPSFFSPVDGSPHPLAKYYKSKGQLFDMQDYLTFFYGSKHIGADNFIPEVHDHISQELKLISDFEKNVGIVDSQSSASELDDLFDSDFSEFLDF